MCRMRPNLYLFTKDSSQLLLKVQETLDYKSLFTHLHSKEQLDKKITQL